MILAYSQQLHASMEKEAPNATSLIIREHESVYTNLMVLFIPEI
jgi:hypothetical protein